MEKNLLQEPLQSAYRKFHSTETAILKVHNDFLKFVDDKKCIMLVLLDLSAAFDTIDHHVLLARLHSRFGISGKALAWIQNYLSNRTQSVIIKNSMSKKWNLQFGVPQGSVLGPILFTLYMSPLGDIIKSHGINYHCYADDTQLYLSFNPKDFDTARKRIEECISDIRSWMASFFV